MEYISTLRITGDLKLFMYNVNSVHYEDSTPHSQSRGFWGSTDHIMSLGFPRNLIEKKLSGNILENCLYFNTYT